MEWHTEKLAYCVEKTRKLNKAIDQPSSVATELLEQATWIQDTLDQLDQALEAAEPPRLTIHGDYCPQNLLFKPYAPPVVLDFEIARLDWRLTDLARSMSRFAFSRFGFNWTRMNCFLSGYTARCPLAAEELRLIPMVWQFLLIRRVIVCWHHACSTQSDRWDAQIQHCLKRLDWIDANRDKLIAHLEAFSGPS